MMAGYRFNKEEYFKETKEVYSNYPTDVSRMEEELDRLQKENPKASSFQKKTWIYRIAARDAEVILFPSSPFYAEIDTGREQNSVTASFPPQPGIGCWLMKQYPDFVDEYGTNYNMVEIAERTKVPKRLIDLFVKDGRFDTVKKQKKCRICHSPISKGIYCNRCALRQIKDEMDSDRRRNITGVMKQDQDMKGEMHFINKNNL